MIAIIALILQIVGIILGYLVERQKISASQADQIGKQLNASLDLLDKARKAAKSAGDAFDKRGSLPDEHDPNLRD